jgi:hypothetical protein
LNVIADFITQAGGESAAQEEEEKTLASGRPIERRNIGKVLRDDAGAGGMDLAYSLPDDYSPSFPDSGRVSPSGRMTPTRYDTPTRNNSGRQTPTRNLTPTRRLGGDSGRHTPTLDDPRDMMYGTGRTTPTRGPPSPRIPVPTGAGMDGEVAATEEMAIFLSAPRRRLSIDGRLTPDGRSSPGLRPRTAPTQDNMVLTSVNGAREQYPLPSNIQEMERRKGSTTASKPPVPLEASQSTQHTPLGSVAALNRGPNGKTPTAGKNSPKRSSM